MTTDSKFWDKIAPKYALSPVRDEAAYEHTLERTRSYFEPHSRVLELGCGTGTTALKLASYASHITATDFSDGMLEIGREKAAKQNVGNVTFRNASAGAASHEDQTYDVVMAFNLMHLVKNVDQAYADIHTALKPGGVFISKTPCLSQGGLGFKFGLMKLMIPLMQLVGKAPFVRLFDVATLEKEITDAGFEIIETGTFPVKPPSRFIVARRR